MPRIFSHFKIKRPVAVFRHAKILAGQFKICPDFPGVRNERRRCIGIGAHRGLSRPIDAGLLIPDLFPGIAQKRHMINTDRADNAAVRVNGVHRVKTSAQADFQNDGIGLLAHEKPQNRESRKFKIREGQLPALGFHPCHGFGKHRIRCLFPVHECPFIKPQQVRRRMHTDLVSRMTQNAFGERTRASLTVGARHRENRAVKMNAHPVNHGLHPRESHVDGFYIEVFSVMKPVVQCGTCRGSREKIRSGHGK